MQFAGGILFRKQSAPEEIWQWQSLIKGIILNISEVTLPQEEEYIHVTFDGSTASVTIPSNITDVTYAVNGAHVTLTSNTTSQEYNYVVDGSSTNGSLTINGSYKFTLTLEEGYIKVHMLPGLE